jgi:4-aminobutyrate aminotransferase / (S)-3-amino-2-methylpropionate transaminase / 5-aminovalerate transaminase
MPETMTQQQQVSSVRLVTPIPGPESRALAGRRAAAVPRAVGSALPIFIKRAHGAIVEDVDGNHFLDFAGGIGCLNTGHTPEPVVAAVKQQAGDFFHACFTVTPYEHYVRTAELLNRITPGSHAKKTAFFNTGAEAVENAIKIARLHTKRSAVIAFQDAFHGRTLLAMSLTSKTSPYKAGFGPFAPEVYRIPYAYCYRCEYNLKYPDCKVACASKLEDTFLRHIAAESVAAVIFEPILGEGGFVVPPPEWFATISEICRKHGVLVIADEVQTGFARTGTTFVSEQFGLVPDLIISAKSMSAGLPLGAVTGRAEIMDAAAPGQLGGTFAGNPLALSAALASWQELETNSLNSRATKIGSTLMEYARRWQQRFGWIGDVRGVGAMVALELVKDRMTREPAKEETQRILNECHQRGLILISAGTYSNVIRFLLPLVISDEQIVEGLNILEAALVAAGGEAV